MNHQMEENLRNLVNEATEKYAREEWIKTQQESNLPLFDYRFDHVQEVVRIAKILAKDTEANLEVIIAASWLHDISKLGVGNVPDHGNASADIARKILVEQGVDLDIINDVCEVIIKHVGLTLEKPLSPLEAQIVWEADKIVKLGASGLIHFIINGIKYKPGLSCIQIAKEIRKFLKLAEEIAASMNTEASKKMALMRLENLRMICKALGEELDLEFRGL